MSQGINTGLAGLFLWRWFLAPWKWLWKMACCFGSNLAGDQQTKDIEKAISRERKHMRRQVKVLLLGAGESGKSTFIKQMVIIHGKGEFTADEVRAYRQQIYQNVISAMRVLLDARAKLKLDWEDASHSVHVEHFTKHLKRDHKSVAIRGSDIWFTVADLLRGIDHSTFLDVASRVADLWSDRAIRQTYDARHLFQITDSCAYFFDNIGRVAQSDYHPTNKDILFCRKATRGITEHEFIIHKVPFRFIDVGGQRSQRQKWFQCFEDITSILFMVASNEYDQVILEDRRTNRVVEARSVFQTIANNKSFANVSIILFLNKTDLLQEKILKSDIRNYFSDFTGDHRESRDVQYFLVDKFENSRKDRHRPFFYHFTTAVDTDNIRRVFEDVRESILERNLKTLMMQ